MNKSFLYVLLAGLTLAWPATLRAESPVDFSALEQRVEKTAFVRQHQPVWQSVAVLNLTWEDKNSSSVKKTACRGALLAAKNRVVTHERCFAPVNYRGEDFRLKHLTLSLKNGQKTLVLPRQIKTSGQFAYINISASLREGLFGAELELVPGAGSLVDVFNSATPYVLFSFGGEIVKTGHLYRGGQFDLAKWGKEAFVGEPFFYQNKLIGMNTVTCRYHYFIKEKPLFTVINEANGGSGLLK